MNKNKINLLSLAVLSSIVISSTPVLAAEKTNYTTKSVNSVEKATNTLGTVTPYFTNWSTDLSTIISNGGVVQEGDVGLSVKQLQFVLRWKGYGILKDGTFGSATKSSVENFQGKNGLRVDGIVGKNTYDKLLGYVWLWWDTNSGIAKIVDFNSNVLYSEPISQ